MSSEPAKRKEINSPFTRLAAKYLHSSETSPAPQWNAQSGDGIPTSDDLNLDIVSTGSLSMIPVCQIAGLVRIYLGNLEVVQFSILTCFQGFPEWPPPLKGHQAEQQSLQEPMPQKRLERKLHHGLFSRRF
jgi:hypothetical protein